MKDFKYTDSALITFLLTGAIGRGAPANLFSDGNKVETQTKAISVSVAQQKKDFKRVKRENEKLIKNTDLELVQLMEQGDYAVKLPWGGWQYGVSGNYNNWKGHYKGRGDKVKNIKYTRGRNTSDKKTVADDNVGAVHASNGETITMNRTSLPSMPIIFLLSNFASTNVVPPPMN